MIFHSGRARARARREHGGISEELTHLICINALATAEKRRVLIPRQRNVSDGIITRCLIRTRQPFARSNAFHNIEPAFKFAGYLDITLLVTWNFLLVISFLQSMIAVSA